MTTKPAYTAADVTVAVMNYNGADLLPELFESVFTLVEPPGEIMIVDDGSTDGGAEEIQRQHPEVRVVSMGENTGLLNKVRNRGLRESTKPLMFMLDNDVTLRADTLAEALKVMNEQPAAAACMTRAVYYDDQEVIYQDGQMLHYVGASPGTHRGMRIAEVDDQPRLSIGWGVQLIDRAAAARVGYFNEEYLLGWGDDGEFNYKLNMRGEYCYQAPRSVVLHKRSSSSKRYYSAVRNRLRFILEMYQLRTILLALPAFFIYELSLLAFVVMKGAGRDYLRGWVYLWSHIGDVLRVRREIQSQRRLRDSELMGAGDIFVYSDEMSSGVLVAGYRMLNLLLNGYWRLIRRFL